MAKKASKGSSKPIPEVEVNLKFSPQQGEELLATLRDRFEQNMLRHEGLAWSEIHEKLKAHPEKLASLYAMESTGGEPDVAGYDQGTKEYIFFDCSEQSPSGRRSICYDREGEAERVRKGVHPGGNAVDLTAVMGIELLNEDEYRQLQTLGEFDTRTESWLKTPAEIRELGGAIFGDRRYNTIFVFHNSAPSFYASRGFRGSLRV
ncbi:MAG: DUF4256 domain-containing protein [Anaerolineales bacterium]|nr:DUF4256 domain-containing protein [Anaerolineales bacterium]